MNPPIDAIEVYEALKPVIGDDTSKRLLRYIDEMTATRAAIKGDVAEIRGKYHVELRAEIEALRAETSRD